MRQLVILAVAIVAILAAPSAARCDDLDDLKAAHAAFVAAVSITAGTAIISLLHDDHIAFLGHGPFPITKPTPEGHKAFWADYERFDARMDDTVPPRYAVYGNTGIVAGYWSTASKQKDGPVQHQVSRATFTYIKSGGKWLLLMAHTSPMMKRPREGSGL